MIKRHGWLAVILVAAFLVTACGPQMSTPTAKVDDPADTAVAPTEAAPPEGTATEPEVETFDPADLPVDPDDWRALGAPDAPVTIIEYSDFQ